MNDSTTESVITITPDPQILHVLSYLEMRPLDGLCELVDNGLDALGGMDASDGGGAIWLDLPTRKEVEEGIARLRVRDNGPGMTLDQVESSLKAGYSSKPRHGSLGLFGVGFNIATGKLGRVTTLTTARADDDFATRTQIDLVSLRKSGSFDLKAHKIAKPHGLQHGTVVEVTQPWGQSHQNHGYMLKLVSIGRPKILAQLGRVYSSILEKGKVRILLGDEAAKPFCHCVWDDSRFVEHAKHGKIPAVFRFEKKVIYIQLVCAGCGANILQGSTKCPEANCGSASSVTHEEFISGWVGIQRYSDTSHFGIDLIRNGRAIRLQEKSAFFEYQDPETGESILDYPVDQRDGRIVGEIHLNHVPVDPAKQNFERSSPEWRRAMEFLRGKSSLQPERPGADSNHSPIFNLFQGYRKVRGPGKRSMYMGKWMPGSNAASLLGKDEIEQLKAKFEQRIPGFFDDAEWWRLVEEADQKPITGLIKCPSCHLDSTEGLDDCPHCGHIFTGKLCLNAECSATISAAAVMCPNCGHSQIPEIQTPWSCGVCRKDNSSLETVCVVCKHPRGTPDPVSREGLSGFSHQDERLSLTALSVSLAAGIQSSPIDVKVFLTDRPIHSYHSDGTKAELPSVRFTDNELTIYIDPKHVLFEHGRVSPEQHVAYEIANYLYQYHLNLASKNPAEHSISKIAHEILRQCWPLKQEAELDRLFESIRRKLADAASDEGSDVYLNLSQDERTALASELIRNGRDVSELAQMKADGTFLLFLRPKGVVEVFSLFPKLFFDGNVWNVMYAELVNQYPEGSERLQGQIRNEYRSLLEIAAIYSEKKVGDPREAEIARAACRLLEAKMD